MGARKIGSEYNTTDEQYYYTNDEQYLNSGYYVEGNTVRKHELEQNAYELPDYDPQEDVQRRRQEGTHTRPKTGKELSSVSKGTCLVLILAIAMTLYVCVDYIGIQSSVTTLNKDIIQMEKELTNLKEENLIHKEQLNANINLDQIYKTATNEYGMIRPSDEQIIYFDSTFTDYVKQYNEIPTNINKSIIDDISN